MVTMHKDEKPKKPRKVGTGRIYLNALISIEQFDYLNKRAAALKWTKAQIGGAIIDYFFDVGAPKLAENDKVIPVPDYPRRERWARVKGTSIAYPS